MLFNEWDVKYVINLKFIIEKDSFNDDISVTFSQ